MEERAGVSQFEFPGILVLAIQGGNGPVDLLLLFLEVLNLNLLFQILGLERVATGFVLQVQNGSLEVVAAVVTEDALSVPVPGENSRLFEALNEVGSIPVDVMVVELNVTTIVYAELGALFDGQGGMLLATVLLGHQLSIGIDQVVVGIQFQDPLIGWLNLEVAVAGGGFLVHLVEGG